MAREEKQSCPEKLVATRRGESNRRCPLPPWRWLAAARAARSSPGELGGHQGREEQPMVYLPPGGGWQPPGRPGAALGSWVATRGGKSSRWYIFPMEEAGSRLAGSEQPWGAGWPPGKGRAADGAHLPPGGGW